MKTFILYRNYTLLLLFFFNIKISSAQTLTSFPYSALKPFTGYTVSANISLSGTDLPGTGDYTWTVSPSIGVTNFLSTTSTNSQIVTFTSAASGPYVFTLSRGDVSIEYTFVVCNLLASVDGSIYNSSGIIGGFSVDKGISSPEAPDGYTFFNNGFSYVSNVITPAIGVNKEGYIYYIPNFVNEGEFNLVAASPNGSIRRYVLNFDINGPNDTTMLIAFIRLGIDASGTGWILAADINYTKLYLVKFATNGTSDIASATVVSSNIAFAGEGSVTDFANGDVAIDGDGMMVVLANDGEGKTVIYSLDTKLSNPVLSKRFEVNDENGQPFTGNVNGVAFDSSGNIYFSSYERGLFYIDKATANTANGTITGTLVTPLEGLVDLATNYWPKSSVVPLRFGNFAGQQNGNNIVLNWTTLSEENLKYFEIEKSYSSNNFTKQDRKNAVGNSSKILTYNFIDTTNNNAEYVYYRLKMVDVDGRYTYSPIIKIKLTNIGDISIYPNPFSKELKLQIQSNKKANILLNIFDVAGKNIFTRKLNIDKGNNTIDLSSKFANAPSGTYFIKIVEGNENILEQKLIRL